MSYTENEKQSYWNCMSDYQKFTSLKYSIALQTREAKELPNFIECHNFIKMNLDIFRLPDFVLTGKPQHLELMAQEFIHKDVKNMVNELRNK
jgi:hypothetical protein